MRLAPEGTTLILRSNMAKPVYCAIRALAKIIVQIHPDSIALYNSGYDEKN